MLVLGLTSLANAGLIFTVNGEVQGPEVTIVEVPSGEIELDLELSAGETITAFKLGYALDNAQAEFLWDRVVFPDVGFDFDGKILEDATSPTPQYLAITAAQMFSPAIPGPLVLMTDLYVHCLEATDVILTISVAGSTIIDGETIPVDTLLHTLIIHQIPEPMTDMLLGLGGLLLRRRK